jgi:hypothetical protein
MTEVIDIVLPVFGLIGIGYVIAWSRLLDENTGQGLVDFVFGVAIPVLIFRIIVIADFSAAGPWRLWLPFFLGFTAAWIAGHQMARRLFGRDARGGLVAGVAAAYGNTVLIGVPLSIAAYGDAGAVAIALIVAVHLPVMMAASAVLIGRAERLDGAGKGDPDRWEVARSLGRNLAANPIIIGIVAGALWRLMGLPLAGVPAVLVSRIADVAATLALLALGLSLRRYGIARNIPAGLALSVLKLVAMPALVLVLARYVVAMPPVWAKVAVIAAACPSGVNVYLVAIRFRTGEALASNAILISTGLGVLSTAFWLRAVEWL